MHVEKKAIEVLMILASSPGHVVPRKQILDSIWPGSLGGDQALNRIISVLRKELHDCAESPHVIETIPGQGYRLIAECNPSTAKISLPLAEGIPLFRKIRPTAYALASCIAVLIGAILILSALSPSQSPAKNEALFRILQVPGFITYLAPTVIPADRPDLRDFASEITKAMHASLQETNHVVLVSDQDVANEFMQVSELRAFTSEPGITLVLGAEVSPLHSVTFVRLFILDAETGDLLWYRSLEYSPAGGAATLSRQINEILLTEANEIINEKNHERHAVNRRDSVNSPATSK